MAQALRFYTPAAIRGIRALVLYLPFAPRGDGLLAGLECLLARVNAPDDAVPELLLVGLVGAV